MSAGAWTVAELKRALDAMPDEAAVLIAPHDDDGDTPAEDVDGVRALVWRDGRTVVYVTGRP